MKIGIAVSIVIAIAALVVCLPPLKTVAYTVVVDYEDMFDVGIGLREAARAIECSTARARRVLREMEELGIIHQVEPGKWCRKI